MPTKILVKDTYLSRHTQLTVFKDALSLGCCALCLFTEIDMTGDERVRIREWLNITELKMLIQQKMGECNLTWVDIYVLVCITLAAYFQQVSTSYSSDVSLIDRWYTWKSHPRRPSGWSHDMLSFSSNFPVASRVSYLKLSLQVDSNQFPPFFVYISWAQQIIISLLFNICV